jgi:hypothetical protein
MLLAGRRRNCGPIHGRDKRRALGPTQSPVQWVPRAAFALVTWQEREADRSLPASTEVNNGGAIPPHLTPSWRDAELCKPRDNFTFTINLFTYSCTPSQAPARTGTKTTLTITDCTFQEHLTVYSVYSKPHRAGCLPARSSGDVSRSSGYLLFLVSVFDPPSHCHRNLPHLSPLSKHQSKGCFIYIGGGGREPYIRCIELKGRKKYP